MPPFLSDPPFTTYLLLAVAALVAGGVWLKNRGPRTRAAVGVIVVLLLVLLAADYFVESPREEAVRRVKAMEVAANARQWDAVGTHVAGDFAYATFKKPTFLAAAGTAANKWGATVNFKDFDRDNFAVLPDGHIRVGFVGQIFSTGNERVPVYIEADFVKQPDGAWLMQTFKVYNYITRTKGGEQRLPGL
jgi:hypothetical protein